jgi:ribosome recycling factor
MQDSVKKLDKILPQDDCKLLQKDMDKLVANREGEAKKLIDAKEKEIKGA